MEESEIVVVRRLINGAGPNVSLLALQVLEALDKTSWGVRETAMLMDLATQMDRLERAQ